MVEDRKNSEKLISFIGETELAALQFQRGTYENYRIFNKANLPKNFSSEEQRIMRQYLLRRCKETKSPNMGCASGKAGEAD